MRSNYILSVGKLVMTLLCVASCKKNVQIDSPPGLVVTANVFKNDAAATAAQVSIYTAMQYASFNMSQSAGLLSDELNGSFSRNNVIIQCYTNSMLATTRDVGPWVNAYNYIYQSNAIIESLQKYSGVHDRVKSQLTGESKFIRAFWHFYLTNCYGDVPLVTSTDYTINAIAPRVPSKNVYEQIIKDLQEAEDLLSETYIDATDTVVSTDRVRPNKYAALSLLSRAYLYNKDWDKAAEAATKVISNTEMYQLEDSLDQVFLTTSHEAIWQLAVPLPTTINTIDGYYFNLLTAPGRSNINTATISAQLDSAFEIGDRRKDKWIGSIPVGASIYYFPSKYKVYQSSDVTEYTMVLRLAEQYLIRAEARAMLGDLDGAMADLNAIRWRAGLLEYSGLKDQSSIFSAIQHEREVELFTEWGHRWFDLIRTGNVNTVMNKVAPEKGGIWNANAQLFPIPQSERLVDFNLTQNPGY